MSNEIAMNQRMHRLLFLLVLSFVLSACAVKPKPMTEEEIWLKTQYDKETLYSGQEPLNVPLTLSMAVARALTYNYDYRLAMMEGAFHRQELTSANFGMLPKLTASAGYTDRSNDSASRSISYFNKVQTLEPSISQERQRTIADLSFNWTVLDFGLSYFQAKQQADRYLIMKERERRVVNNITKDVIVVFWRVAMSEIIAHDVNKALRETETALKYYRQARQSGLEPLLESLENEKRLLQIASGLKRIKSDAAQAKAQLAALISLPSGTAFKIVIPDRKILYKIPKLPSDIEALEDLALFLRPDMREDNYQERIDKVEVKKEVLRMVPGLNVLGNLNYDSNTYSLHSTWAEASTKINLDILGLFGKYQQYKSTKVKAEVGRMRSLANMVAAIVQVHLAYHQYELALEDYNDNVKMKRLEEQIYQVTFQEAEGGQISELKRVNHHASLIAAKLQQYHSLTSIYDAWGNLYFTLGGNLVGELPYEGSLEEKSVIISKGLQYWWSGQLPQALASKPYSVGEDSTREYKEQIPSKATRGPLNKKEREVSRLRVNNRTK